MLASYRHSFNLDFPPPAFLGDVDGAPVVILMANGGYDPVITPGEFSNATDVAEYLQYLRGDRTTPPSSLSAYYSEGGLYRWISTGKAAIVNAVPYRSTKISKEIRQIAKLLPSAMAHQKWLREEVLPTAMHGRRLVVAHRPGLWAFSRAEAAGMPNVLCSPNPVSPHLSRTLMEEVSSWLGEKAECAGREF